ncbi:MAG TPA: nucleoside triphosphate pyrophosphohydrolase family protein, partial [Gemmatimonadales bacterium]|nr:nucleoside triphosphate pyrophosphohydrolase family protein [Gemmatimonadales bacterium]
LRLVSSGQAREGQLMKLVRSEPLLERLEALRDADDVDDAILDLMDEVEGWCSPHRALAAEAMTFSEYQHNSLFTASYYEDRTLAKAVFGLGIAGEAGEVADLIKKWVGHGHPADTEKLAKELGDVLWYVAALSAEFGLDMGEIAQLNIDKLRARYPEGFSTERSLNRKENQ